MLTYLTKKNWTKNFCFLFDPQSAHEHVMPLLPVPSVLFPLSCRYNWAWEREERKFSLQQRGVVFVLWFAYAKMTYVLSHDPDEVAIFSVVWYGAVSKNFCRVSPCCCVQTGNLLMRNSDGSTTDTLQTAGEALVDVKWGCLWLFSSFLIFSPICLRMSWNRGPRLEEKGWRNNTGLFPWYWPAWEAHQLDSRDCGSIQTG